MTFTEEKQILLQKFVEYLKIHYYRIFQNKSILEMLDDQDYNIEREFYMFIGIEKVDVNVYENINKSKFIELSLSYIFSEMKH